MCKSQTNNNFIRFQKLYNYRYRVKRLKLTTYIFAARCKNGVAIISDRLEARGQKRDYVDKIERPGGLPVVFAAAGVSFLFKDYIKELSRKVAVNAGLKEFDIQKWTAAGLKDQNVINNYRYNTHDFIIECTNLLREFRALYESSAKEGMLLQVVFSVPETIGDINRPRLFYADLIKCEPIPIDNQCHAIGQANLASEFKDKWKDDMTMAETVKLATFIIKYIEKSGLSKDEYGIDTVGIGNSMPQVYFFVDNETQPKAIEGEELRKMISGVDAELEKAMKFDKDYENYLEEFPTLWALK